MTPRRIRSRSWLGITTCALIACAACAALIAGCGGASTRPAPALPAPPPPPPARPPADTTKPPATPDNAGAPSADLGATVFAQRCALCHGPDGHGDGPGAKALNPKP